MYDDHVRQQYEAFLREHPIFRIEDLVQWGLRRNWLKVMRREGAILPACRGWYMDSDYWPGDRELITVLFGEHTVCLLSALWLHRILDEEPEQVWFSLRSSQRVPRHTEELSPRFVRMSGAAYTYGVVEAELYERRVRVYSLEKTLADCLKFRRLIGEDLADRACRRAIAQARVDPEAFAEAVRVCRVQSIAAPFLVATTRTAPSRTSTS